MPESTVLWDDQRVWQDTDVWGAETAEPQPMQTLLWAPPADDLTAVPLGPMRIFRSKDGELLRTVEWRLVGDRYAATFPALPDGLYWQQIGFTGVYGSDRLDGPLVLPVPAATAGVSLVDLKRHLNYRAPADEHDDDLELELFLLSSISVVEDIVGPLASQEVTETVRTATGTAVLRRCPVLSVSSPAGLTLNGPAGIITGLPPHGGEVTVTYTAGQTVRPEQRLAILLVAQDLWTTQRGAAGPGPLDDPNELTPDPTLLRRVRLLLRATALPPSVA